MMNQQPLETDRLFLREISEEDVSGLYELDSDPRVHQYLGNKPLQSKEEVYPIIEYIQNQYKTNGIGRWAMIEKSTGHFMGWTGLKLETKETNGFTNYYDLGYRIIPKYWGKGYATESALFAVEYGFKELGIKKLCGAADVENIASNRVLQKAGLKFINEFLYDNIPCNWYERKKE